LDPRFGIIVLPPLEQSFSLGMDMNYLMGIQVLMQKWLSGDERRKSFPKLYQMMAEGERIYYDYLTDFDFEGCKSIPCLRIKSFESSEDDLIKNQILSFKQQAQTNGLIVQRTFSCMCYHVRYFREEELNNDFNSLLNWMKNHLKVTNNHFMVEKYIEKAYEYRIFVCDGKASRCIVDRYNDQHDVGWTELEKNSYGI